MIKKPPVLDFTDITITKKDLEIKGVFNRLDRVNEMLLCSDNVEDNFEILAGFENNNEYIPMLDYLADYLLEDSNFLADEESMSLYDNNSFAEYPHLNKRGLEIVQKKENLYDLTSNVALFEFAGNIGYKSYYNNYGDTSEKTYRKRMEKLESQPLESFPEMARGYMQTIQDIRAKAKEQGRRLSYHETISIGNCRNAICDIIYDLPIKRRTDRYVRDMLINDMDETIRERFARSDFFSDTDKIMSFILNVENIEEYNDEDSFIISDISNEIILRLEHLQQSIDNSNRNLPAHKRLTFVNTYKPIIEKLLAGENIRYIQDTRKRLDTKRGIKRVCNELSLRTHLYI